MATGWKRQLHFDKYIRNQDTAEGYLLALRNSPYRTHRRMAVLLKERFDLMVKEKESGDIINLNKEEKEIADTYDVQAGRDTDKG